jgi:hypothetical protein
LTPSNSGSQKRLVTEVVRISPKVKEKLKYFSRRDKLYQSTIIEMLIDHAMDLNLNHLTDLRHYTQHVRNTVEAQRQSMFEDLKKKD